MMFSVTWAIEAVRLLNQLVSAADNPQRIRDAATRIDFALRRNPVDHGESRSTLNERVWYEDVLGVDFFVDQGSMTVRVLTIGPSRRL